MLESTIAEPYYGYDVLTEKVVELFAPDSIDVMAIGNLPNELPRDASEDFGNMLISRVIPKILKGDSEVIDQATIAKNGMLNTPYLYLKDYVGV